MHHSRNRRMGIRFVFVKTSNIVLKLKPYTRVRYTGYILKKNALPSETERMDLWSFFK